MPKPRCNVSAASCVKACAGSKPSVNSLPVITVGMARDATIEADIDATVLLVSYGAFVMNTHEESARRSSTSAEKFGRMQ